MTNAEARFNNSLRPRKPEGSLGRTAQDGHLDSHTAPELCVGLFVLVWLYNDSISTVSRQRPYHVESTGSRPITEVKQRRARLVPGWVTAWEHRVLLVIFFFSPLNLSSNMNKRNSDSTYAVVLVFLFRIIIFFFLLLLLLSFFLVLLSFSSLFFFFFSFFSHSLRPLSVQFFFLELLMQCFDFS